jgi:hypothetical protein
MNRKLRLTIPRDLSRRQHDTPLSAKVGSKFRLVVAVAPRRRWMDNIKMDLLEIGVNVVDWIGLA